MSLLTMTGDYSRDLDALRDYLAGVKVWDQDTARVGVLHVLASLVPIVAGLHRKLGEIEALGRVHEHPLDQLGEMVLTKTGKPQLAPLNDIPTWAEPIRIARESSEAGWDLRQTEVRGRTSGRKAAVSKEELMPEEEADALLMKDVGRVHEMLKHGLPVDLHTDRLLDILYTIHMQGVRNRFLINQLQEEVSSLTQALTIMVGKL